MKKPNEYLSQNKNGTWYYQRRVPTDVARIAGGKQIIKTLKTKNYAIAVEKASRMNALFEDEWAHVLASGGVNPGQTHKLAVKKAQNLNVQYFEGEQLLVANKFEDVINRIAYLEEN